MFWTRALFSSRFPVSRACAPNCVRVQECVYLRCGLYMKSRLSSLCPASDNQMNLFFRLLYGCFLRLYWPMRGSWEKPWCAHTHTEKFNLAYRHLPWQKWTLTEGVSPARCFHWVFPAAARSGRPAGSQTFQAAEVCEPAAQPGYSPQPWTGDITATQCYQQFEPAWPIGSLCGVRESLQKFWNVNRESPNMPSADGASSWCKM